MTVVSVVIPYYQKTNGILRRALTSVLAQKVAPDVRVQVIVVDDGSPWSPKGEIEGLVFADPFHLTLIEQPNGGVSVARNTGLRAVGEDATYIAFLDSDDSWKPEHLATALAALNQNYDFYFCDNKRIGHYESLFLSLLGGSLFKNTKARRIGDDLYEIGKDAFFDYFLRNFVTQISTVVVGRVVSSGIFFDSFLRAAGEDRLYLLQLISNCHRICCSSQVRVICGQGINIYNSRYSWDNEGHLLRHMEDLLALCSIEKTLSLLPSHKKYIMKLKMELKRTLAFLTIRYFIKYRKMWSKELRNMTRKDPTFWRWYPLSLLYVIVMYPLGLYLPLKQ